MKIAVVGSREFKDIKFERNVILKELIFAIPDIEENPNAPDPILISGGARGIDTLAEEVAKSQRIETKIFPAEWNKYGKGAGFIRNELIIKEADRVIAFWDGRSKGTKHSINIAILAHKPIDIYIR